MSFSALSGRSRRQDGKTLAVEAKVHRLDRSPSIASERPGTAEGKAPRPEDRKPEASPSGEPRGSQAAATTPAPRKSWRRPLMFALLPVALIAGGYFYVTGGAVMSTDNAYVQADMVGLSTDVAGIVTEVLVHDNQKVAKGDILFKLDPLQFQLALDRAEAQVGNTRNDLVALQSSYRNMQAQVEQAQKDADFNMVNFQRQEQLIANNFTPKATYDAARNTLQGSQQKLASLRQQLAGLAANLNGDPDAPIESHPKYRDAVAARDEAARQLAHTVVHAPFAGIVTNVPSLHPGQYLAAAAGRHERGGECRHRTRPRISRFHNRSLWIGGLKWLMPQQFLRSRSTGPRLRCVSSSPSSCRRWIRRSPTSRCPICRAACRRARIRSTGC